MNQIIDIVSKYECVEKVLVFGSRARMDYKINSDIDIAICGKMIDKNELNIMEDEIREINTIIDFDIVYFENLSKKSLKNNIIRDGVEIYAKR
nr:nucleotidyltransferase domain-containing protein [Clostridium muellerianum]